MAMRNFSILIISLVLIFFFTSCISTTEKNAGVYSIDNYTINGEDSLSQITRNFMDGDLALKEDLTFQLQKNTQSRFLLNDSSILYSGKYVYHNNGKEIEFFTNYIFISVCNGNSYDIIYFSGPGNPGNGNFQPSLFLDKKWEIKKEGKNSLELVNNGNDYTTLVLLRR